MLRARNRAFAVARERHESQLSEMAGHMALLEEGLRLRDALLAQQGVDIPPPPQPPAALAALLVKARGGWCIVHPAAGRERGRLVLTRCARCRLPRATWHGFRAGAAGTWGCRAAGRRGWPTM